MSTQSDVFIAEVANHGDARFHSEGVWAAQLHAEAGSVWAVTNGLSVTTDGANLFWCDGRLVEQSLAGVRVVFSQLKADGAGPVNFVIARLAEAENLAAKALRDGLAQGADQCEMVVTNVGDDSVDTVQTGASHQPYE
ncbi:hypothetical protein AS19_03770 [Alcanivorax sp. NBRC 101098]|nr:hypothetical protein AS19_03770 [Alcanivorax sp. NBRC 101098]